MAGEKLAKALVGMVGEGSGDETDLLFGVVSSTSPLKVKIDNRFEVDSSFLILSMLVQPMKIKIESMTTSTEGGFKHTHIINDKSGKVTDEYKLVENSQTGHKHTVSGQEIQLWGGLQVGDTVRLLKVNKGQMFYVLERG